MAELAHNATLYPHWPGHGDLRIEIRDDVVYLRADQVERLARIQPWSTGETLIEDHWPATFAGHPYYELDVAVARCEAADTEHATAFLIWLAEQLEQLLTDETIDAAVRPASFTESHPVDRAARILDADPAISIGRNGLFAHMHALGWIERPTGDWTITGLARRSGWLTTRGVQIPATTKARMRVYPQIYITPAGLDELRRTLHALNPATPDIPPHPALFD